MWRGCSAGVALRKRRSRALYAMTGVLAFYCSARTLGSPEPLKCCGSRRERQRASKLRSTPPSQHFGRPPRRLNLTPATACPWFVALRLGYAWPARALGHRRRHRGRFKSRGSRSGALPASPPCPREPQARSLKAGTQISDRSVDTKRCATLQAPRVRRRTFKLSTV